MRRMTRARPRTGELNVATMSVCRVFFTGRHGAGHALVLLQKCKVLVCDVVGLQETQRLRRAELTVAGYRVF